MREIWTHAWTRINLSDTWQDRTRGTWHDSTMIGSRVYCLPAGAARSDQGRVAVDTACKLCPARSAAPRIARRRVCYSLFSCLIISFFVQVIIRFCRRKNGSVAMLHERFLFSGANVSRDASLNLNFVQFQSIENVPLSLFHDKCFVHMDTCTL